MISFQELLGGVVRNISYWSNYVSRKTSIEKEDAYQELLLVAWEEYCRKGKQGKPITRYYMQKRLTYAAGRIIQKFYRLRNVQRLIFSYIDEEFIDPSYQDDQVKEYVSLVIEELIRISSHEPRTIKLISLLKDGYKNCEIAKKLKIGENTVSLAISRKIKKRVKEIVSEQSMGFIYTGEKYVEIYR